MHVVPPSGERRCDQVPAFGQQGSVSDVSAGSHRIQLTAGGSPPWIIFKVATDRQAFIVLEWNLSTLLSSVQLAAPGD